MEFWLYPGLVGRDTRRTLAGRFCCQPSGYRRLVGGDSGSAVPRRALAARGSLWVPLERSERQKGESPVAGSLLSLRISLVTLKQPSDSGTHLRNLVGGADADKDRKALIGKPEAGGELQRWAVGESPLDCWGNIL